MHPAINSLIPRQQRGMSLIEVLIAVLVLAIGMLGIAALQATALRNSQSSLERTQAVVHGYAILDAMRANLAETRAGRYDMTTCADPARAAPSETTEPDADTQETLASNDRLKWLDAIRAELGDRACGQITCAPVEGGQARDCTVKVRWDDSRGTAGAEAHTIAIVSRL